MKRTQRKTRQQATRRRRSLRGGRRDLRRRRSRLGRRSLRRRRSRVRSLKRRKSGGAPTERKEDKAFFVSPIGSDGRYLKFTYDFKRTSRAGSGIILRVLEDGGGADDDGGAGATMEIECPPGVGPGETVEIDLEDGTTVEVAVPEGIEEGDTFEIEISTPVEPAEDGEEPRDFVLLVLPNEHVRANRRLTLRRRLRRLMPRRFCTLVRTASLKTKVVTTLQKMVLTVQKVMLTVQ